MRYGRILLDGRSEYVTPNGSLVRLTNGRELPEDAVTWLSPFTPRTIFAVGLNYAQHARELSFNTQTEPLIFLKGNRAIAGHRAATQRPADATFMHYECELAVVIGRPGRHIRRERALDHVAGYTIANDYAVRDYLENYYRPNLRPKNRDGATLLGPWIVDTSEIQDPQALALRTTVNGVETQRGHTRDMVHSVADLITYLSGFMTLSAGDVILTGTPEGIVDVSAGDEVVCEIESIGRLVNTLTTSRSRPVFGGTVSREEIRHG